MPDLKGFAVALLDEAGAPLVNSATTSSLEGEYADAFRQNSRVSGTMLDTAVFNTARLGDYKFDYHNHAEEFRRTVTEAGVTKDEMTDLENRLKTAEATVNAHATAPVNPYNPVSTQSAQVIRQSKDDYARLQEEYATKTRILNDARDAFRDKTKGTLAAVTQLSTEKDIAEGGQRPNLRASVFTGSRVTSTFKPQDFTAVSGEPRLPARVGELKFEEAIDKQRKQLATSENTEEKAPEKKEEPAQQQSPASQAPSSPRQGSTSGARAEGSRSGGERSSAPGGSSNSAVGQKHDAGKVMDALRGTSTSSSPAAAGSPTLSAPGSSTMVPAAAVMTPGLAGASAMPGLTGSSSVPGLSSMGTAGSFPGSSLGSTTSPLSSGSAGSTPSSATASPTGKTMSSSQFQDLMDKIRSGGGNSPHTSGLSGSESSSRRGGMTMPSSAGNTGGTPAAPLKNMSTAGVGESSATSARQGTNFGGSGNAGGSGSNGSRGGGMPMMPMMPPGGGGGGTGGGSSAKTKVVDKNPDVRGDDISSADPVINVKKADKLDPGPRF